MCWDEHGRLFVCELHGYNLEGQYDIEELNRAGKLDREVRRIQANEQAKEAARAGTYGTVKLLRDSNGDGVMDSAEVFADHLPAAYGICPARGGIIVACAPDIVFLADRDSDGHAEVRETLFTGFATGALERGINQPQWGLDDWIYFGKGHGGGTITGPHLAKPVQLGNTDFRIKADGSAIESITGSTHTFGHAFTEDGERFISTTSVPGLFVTPLPWHYLARNPDAAAPRTEQSAAEYTRVFPLAAPHPWRTKRAQDPGFFKYYRDRYGAGDSDPGGWFTSACGPLVYQDVALPADCRGAYFVCEPAQNLIHRAVIERDGAGLRLRRAPGEEAGEFIASRDPWFHPIHLAHGPEGALWIVDMYREIIEDYSAIPRYLQQQYGLTNGISQGRLWRLTHDAAPRAPSADMSKLNASGLAKEAGSPHFWRRQTARRLLVERNAQSVAPALSQLAREAKETSAVLNALYTLDALGDLKPDDAAAALKHSDAAVRRHGLRFAERWLDAQPALLESALHLANDQEAPLLLQTALSLGESTNARVLPTLASLARSHGDLKWMPNAILSSLHNRGGPMVDELMNAPERIGSAKALLEPLCAAIAARHDERELAPTISRIAAAKDIGVQTVCLRGLQNGLKGSRAIALASAGRAALNQLLVSDDGDIRRLATAISGSLAADPATQKALLAKATREIGDVKLPAETRLAAVAQLSASDDASATAALLAAWPANTPKVRDAILDAVFSRRDRLPAVLELLERKTIPPAVLTAFQRVTLLENDQPAIRERAARLLTKSGGASDDTFHRFAAALTGERDKAHGERVFRDNCATCH
ncbi:MAG TPA: PVC-type heme-binding CxxCH protein, partial [Verrucomicrobiae bacterium]|nr:PVC-type heme-binding CxxCH protein [Verrucomicrobiae bacterium]